MKAVRLLALLALPAYTVHSEPLASVAAARPAQAAPADADSDGDGIPDAKDPYPIIADFNLLTWDVHSLRFGWSIQTEARVLEQSSLTWTAGQSETKIEGDKNVIQGTVGVDIVGRSGGALNSNPLQAFGLHNFTASLEARAKAGISFQKEMEWGSKRQEETRRAAEYFSKMTKETRISDPFLSVWITFRNHSPDDLYLRPRKLPVFASGRPVCSASVVEQDGPDGLLIPADRPEGVEVEFRAPLDTTTAQWLLAGLGSGGPSVDLAKSSSVIRRSDGSGDAISAAKRIEGRTVEISISSGDVRWSWRIAHQDARNLRPVTLRMALDAISARLSQEFGPERAPLFVIKNSKLSQLAATDVGDRKNGLWEATTGGVGVQDLRQLELDQPLRIGAPTAFAYRTTNERYQLAKGAVDSRDADRVPSAVEVLRELAEAGFAPAQRTYGHCVDYGIGRPKDHTEAHRWYMKAAEQGDAGAQHNVGVNYSLGEGVTKDYAQAVFWLRKAAEQGDALAQGRLGFMYEAGRGIAKDDAQAVAWYRKAAEQGNAVAQGRLGFMFFKGRGVPKDDAQAVAWYRKAAQQGDAAAQRELGWMHDNGRGVPEDDAQAAEWYRKSAQQGDAYAQGVLGLMYLKGEGVPKDDAQAAAWFRKAAEQGDGFAQYNLGELYAEGRGVPKDDAQALEWYRKAAEQGSVPAQFHLGVMYRTGKGVTKDDSQAAVWFRKAAEQGSAGAQSVMGDIHAFGRGVRKDEAQAVAWYRKAAEQGHDHAQCNLGLMYAQGRGVPEDLVQAYVWSSLSSIQGNKSAAEVLDRLAKRMTRDQIAEAERLAREFKPKVTPTGGGN